eukprot:CAMPEP_0178446214 /NCGR_PEP_ID=MMETSP0689_2-20121128/40666_1 /TAXON_ID=160604 /ORGANISM="Amphidinium massartii, Strain CS-259" /LENGTH=751 /DNA_ID=CAMNT_0020070987 /DNA_START=64 /DNA_END=2316 /DNA_ORIENTATION=+
MKKASSWRTLLAVGFFCTHAFAADAKVSLASNEPRTITKVVKMLQGLLETSQAEGETERTLYGKFKCYCDQNKEEKTAAIQDAAKQLEMLASAIEELKAANAAASQEAAKFKAAMEANLAAQKEMMEIDADAKKEYADLEADLTAAIDQMVEAIKVLTEVGADQTLQSGEDHRKFMAGYGQTTSLVRLQSQVTKALSAASAFIPEEKKHAVDAFLQAPFTGTYTAQSGQVVGILKQMRDTFSMNLDAAEAAETKRLQVFAEAMAAKKKAYKSSSDAYDAKQAELSANDGDLSAKKEQYATLEAQKQSDEDFLAQLVPMCDTKAKEYEERKTLRASEEAAIAEAISILNSDAAFATFGKVSATKTGATEGPADFLQLRSIRAHQPEPRQAAIRAKAVTVLEQVSSLQTLKVNKIASLLRAGNPFNVVLSEIDKMLAVITKEGENDVASKEWCAKEQGRVSSELQGKEGDISDLTDEIGKLEDIIQRPVTGLLEQIAKGETDLQQNRKNQQSETEQRKEANAAYQKDVKELQKAEDLLQRAIQVLDTYYQKIRAQEEALLQTRESPAPPQTWEGSYKGAADGEGSKALEMLQYILSETQKEESEAHKDEKEAQQAFEDMMSGLTSQEASLQESLATLKQTLADRQKELLETKQDLKETEADAAAMRAYLAQIEPGCTFIQTNFADREAFRAKESAALENAKDLIKGTPAYVAAEASAHAKSLGSCLSVCGDEEMVQCKACLADVSVPAYCAAN